ncbi:MAG: MerR family transcriptional regulator [Nitriliruptorales bacterium]|nr:MerR family transcriptional regulator [Nitriliruptorales bacterium]
MGEVLNRLKQDFEDISISKIRFLESEGLISPDRTESGYRKFSDDDVDRLRFILTAQRDHYLPLKVIREQLERVDSGQTDTPASNGMTGVLPGMEPPSPFETLRSGESDDRRSADDQPFLDGSTPASSISFVEFCETTGLQPAEVRALKEFGILSGKGNDAALFDADDLTVARAARELIRHGLEPRHLRMYRQFVDREMSLFEQLVTPLMRQRNPEARRRASRQLETLASATNRLKRAVLVRALRSHLHGG